MKTLIKHLYFSISFIICLPAYSAVYYVSTGENASDSNSGTQESPWSTPQKAASTAIAGDTVMFEDGIYNLTKEVRFRNQGTSDAPIIFRSVNKHGAAIHVPTNLGGAGDALFSIGIYSSGWLTDQEMYLIFDGLDLSGGSRHTIQSAGGGQLIIRNNIIHDSGNDTIKINSGANNVLIENNEIYNSGVEESNCDVNDCNSDGIDITSSDFVMVKRNHIHNIASWGLYTKKGSKNTIVENNLIHDVLEGGIGLGESTVTYNAIARNNILYNIQNSCLQFAGAKDSKFYNNTCYNVSTYQGGNWAGMRVAPAQHTAGADEGDDKYSRNIEFYNNIVVINNSEGVCFKASDPSFNGSGKSAHIAQIKMDNNLCYNLTQNITYKWVFEGHEETGIENWRAYTQSLGSELSKNAIIGQSPEILEIDNASQSDFFMLSESSPAVNSGYDLPSYVSTDYYGTTRSNQTNDIGAVEYTNYTDKMPTPSNAQIIKN